MIFNKEKFYYVNYHNKNISKEIFKYIERLDPKERQVMLPNLFLKNNTNICLSYKCGLRAMVANFNGIPSYKVESLKLKEFLELIQWIYESRYNVQK